MNVGTTTYDPLETMTHTLFIDQVFFLGGVVVLTSVAWWEVALCVLLFRFCMWDDNGPPLVSSVVFEWYP